MKNIKRQLIIEFLSIEEADLFCQTLRKISEIKEGQPSNLSMGILRDRVQKIQKITVK